MAITASGLYGLTLEKFLNVTSLPASGLESETAVKVLMVTNSHTPNYDTHNFRDDVEGNEVTGTNYAAGGTTITSTEIATATPAAGQLNYDAADVSWATSTISSARAAIGYFARGGASSADEVIFLSNFGADASTSAGTFTIQWHANGIFYIDHTP